MWFNLNHLREAEKFSGATVRQNIIKLYSWHFLLAITEAIFLFLLAIASIIHAIFPPIFNFKLLEIRIKWLMRMKKKLPKDPWLQKLIFEDTNEH